MRKPVTKRPATRRFATNPRIPNSRFVETWLHLSTVVAGGQRRAHAARSSSINPGLQRRNHGSPIVIDGQRRFAMKTLAATLFLIASIGTPALADYYIVKDLSTRKCMVVSDRPIDTSQVLLSGAYETHADALRALPRVCDEKG